MSNKFPKPTTTRKTTFAIYPILDVEVESTGQCGGDSGHGAQHKVTLKMSSGDLDLQPLGDPFYSGGEIHAGGDHEAVVLGQALIWAGMELLKMNDATNSMSVNFDCQQFKAAKKTEDEEYAEGMAAK